MSNYLEEVIQASGGHAAPAENLELPEEYSEEFAEFDEDDLAALAELQSLDTGEEIFEDLESLIADADGYGGECPPATQDLQLNLTNRQNAIDNVGYGPLNPAEPNEEFWQDKADRWNIEITDAKTAVCGNCIFFVRTPKMLDCIEEGIGLGNQEAEGSIEAGELGYCNALDFKCASERTCNAWAAGGPIIEEEEESMQAAGSSPCWDGYKQVGMKKGRTGKMVPNCVPASEAALIAASPGSKPAPKKDQIKGSSRNKKGSAETGKGVTFSKAIETSLSKKSKEHNEKAPDGRKTSVRTLKAVYRRGAGAFSVSHRPGQNRNSWAMARVNAFLKLLKSGKPKNAKYTTDNDLLPASHPKSSKTASAVIVSSAELTTADDGMSELANDPCWDGYKQVGMKKKGNRRVPNCVPTSASIDYIVNSYSADYGVSRKVSMEDAYAVARQAFEKYSYLENDDDVYSAVVYDLITYATYATTAQIDEEDDASQYSDYLPEGHPALESSLLASAHWVAGAPELDNSTRDVIMRAFDEATDYVVSLHASTRLRAVIAGGTVSESTLLQLQSLSNRYFKVI